MKANELMIGDWIYSTFCDEPCKVVGIEQYESGYAFVKVTNVSGAKDINSLIPLPLTPEILEKNGFVKNHGVTSWKFETNKEDFIDIYGVNNYHLSINIEDTHGSGKGYRWILNNLTIFYVHQLQDALRLCGIEKEIIL